MHLKCAISHKGRVAIGVASCPPISSSFTGSGIIRTFGVGIDIEKHWKGELTDMGRRKRLSKLRERILCDEV